MKKTEITKIIRGKCKKCGKSPIEYGKVEFVGNDVLYFPYTCNCGHVGREFFTLQYLSSE